MTDTPPPLNYRSGQEEPDPTLAAFAKTGNFIGGFVVGPIIILFLGFGAASISPSPREFEFHSLPFSILFFAITATGIFTTIWGLWRSPRKWFLAGFALGAGLFSIMEGACFISG